MSSVPAITVAGLSQVIRRERGARRHRSHRRRGHDLCPARPQRRRQDDDGADPVHPDPGRLRPDRVAGHDVVTDPDGVRAAIGVTGQFSAVDDLLTGEENLRLMADLHHLGRGRRPAAGGRAAGPLRPGRRRTQAGVNVFRGDAPPAGPGDDPGRHATADLSRRAHHRAGPAQPPHHVAQHPRAGGRRGDDLPDHPVPRRGRPARRPDRGAGPRPDRRRGQSRRAQAPHPGRSRPAPVRRPGGVEVGRRPARPGIARRGEPHPAGARRRHGRLPPAPARPTR